MLQPSRRKYRKEQKGRNTGISHERGTKVSFGDFGLKAVGRGRITARQIEAARRAMTRHIRRGGRIWIRVFPDKPISEKPAEVRMGSGKGNPEYYVAEIRPARFFMKWTEWMRRWLVKRSVWLLPNCHCRRYSLSVSLANNRSKYESIRTAFQGSG